MRYSSPPGVNNLAYGVHVWRFALDLYGHDSKQEHLDDVGVSDLIILKSGSNCLAQH